MDIKNRETDFRTIDWSLVPRTEHPGEMGKAFWRTVEIGGVRIRMVEYSAGYRADHWCSRGHAVHVLDGELTTELQDGRTFTLSAGMSYHAADDRCPHRSRTETGVRLFIVD